MAFDATNFSSRKLQGRRFTGLANDSQEAFTQTFDLQSVEVLTDDRYIPTSSLPYSGSSQHEFTVARSYYDNSIVSGSADNGDSNPFTSNVNFTSWVGGSAYDASTAEATIIFAGTPGQPLINNTYSKAWVLVRMRGDVADANGLEEIKLTVS